mmetsp:Transcript_74885/g.212055  ORF Transcript_74885/g.212055 Transcript_74885/m.212055 type:complete len:282 (-) Transcript_74885:59-904(-)
MISWNTSWVSGRVLGHTVRQRSQAVTSIAECIEGSSLSYSHSTIFRATASGLVPWNGSLSVAILYRRQPIAHTSVLLEYGWDCTISGELYKIVPTIVFIMDTAAALLFCRARPKSTILTASVCELTSTLLGVRSRWAMSFSTCRYFRARQSCTRILSVCSSGRRARPFARAELAKACRETPRQYSMTIHNVAAAPEEEAAAKESQYLTTFGWSSWRSSRTSEVMSRAASSCATGCACGGCGDSDREVRVTSFRANSPGAPSCRLARCTLPNAPAPTHSSSS